MERTRYGPRGRASGHVGTGLAVALAMGFWAGGAQAQNVGTVTGLVRDAVSLTPLAGAQVTIEGTQIGGLANNVGRYLLLNVPVGQQTISVQLIGYGSATQTVSVPTGGNVVADFTLREEALSLEGVVVTGTAGQARRREIGNQISQVSAADIEMAAVTDIGDILQGRSTGVQINDFNGQVGTASQIRIRGNNSMAGGNQPLIYIDGLRMEESVIMGDDDEAGSSASAFDMINPNDIERIEIVKGPAATTLYGTEAAGGVIQIFTKRGSAGAPAWSLNVDQGFSNMGFQGGSLNQKDINPTGFYLNDCTVHREFDGAAYLAGTSNGWVTDPTPFAGCPDNGSWFQNGYMQRYNLSVRGGGETVTYFVSGRWNDEGGVVGDQGAESYGVRANVAFQPLSGMDISFNNNYQHRNVTWIPDGNNASGFTLNVMRGEAGYTPDDDHSLVFENEISSAIDQFQTSASIGWSPNTMWSHRLNAGLDYTVMDFVDWKYWDYFEVPQGDRENDQEQDRNLTLDYNASLNYSPWQDVTSRFSFGGQIFEESNYGINGFDATFAARGLVLVGDGTERDVDEGRSRVRSGGFFLQEALGWRDRLFLTGGIRWDGFSTFGEGFGLAAYPKVSGSYVLSDESFWPIAAVEQLKLRAAWGQSGRAPGAFDAETVWDATSADEGVPAVVLSNFGNPDLGPEKSTELELGFDASALGGRVTLEFTWYDQKTTDALVSIPPISSTGTNNGVLQNIGRVDNWGTETMLNVVPVRTASVEWSVGAQYTTNQSEVVDRGVLTGGGSIRVGYPLLSNRDDVLRTFCHPEDADYAQGCDFDNDGDVDVFDPNAPFDPSQPPRLAERWLGPLFPTDIVSLNTRLTLWQSLTLDVLGEGQFGHVKSVGHAYQNMRRSSYDNPVWPYCLPTYAVWRDGDATTLTNQQVVECVVEYSDQGVWTQKSKASFMKLRSATLAWRVPEEWVPGARSVQLSVQGKNLFTVTDYIGLDPEASDNGAGDSSPGDYYTFGPPRTFIFGLTVNF